MILSRNGLNRCGARIRPGLPWVSAVPGLVLLCGLPWYRFELQWRKVKPGMSGAEVQALLGVPDWRGPGGAIGRGGGSTLAMGYSRRLRWHTVNFEGPPEDCTAYSQASGWRNWPWLQRAKAR